MASSADGRRGIRRLGLIGLAVLAGSVATRLAAPPVAPRINVRWSSELSGDQRITLERQFHLVASTHLDGATWAYDAHDTSGATIRALLEHPAVADTHGIDRQLAAIAPDAPRGTTRSDAASIGTWAASRYVSWIIVASAWIVVLSGLTLAATRHTATHGTSPRTQAPI